MAQATKSSDRSSKPRLEQLETRLLPALIASEVVPLLPPGGPAATPPPLLTQTDVQAILQRAGAATASNDGIIAVVDRNGRPLGIAVESGVDPSILANPEKLTFAVDGALSEARTGAFFGNDTAPLTSRTIEEISQSALTQREIESDPNNMDPNSPVRGPGFVAPIGSKSHFPPNIPFTPQVDLSQIEHTNRDGSFSVGADGIRGTADDQALPGRFNINDFLPGQQLFPPDSYGFISGYYPSGQNRGIGTLPGGVPIFKGGSEVGGIGVFYPGKTGYADEENSALSANYDPTKPDRSIEAEIVAIAAIGGSTVPNFSNLNFSGPIGGVALDPTITLPAGRIDLVGVTLDVFGPGGLQGPDNLVRAAANYGLFQGTANVNFLPVVAGNPFVPGNPFVNTTTTMGFNQAFQSGLPVPQGWIVAPHDGVGITADQVRQIIEDGINTANLTRAQIRLPLGERTRMVLAVADKTGTILGLYRMPDATVFSIDVAVAKARNVAYYNDPNQLQKFDEINGIPPGVAFTNRTFRYASEPRFPEGIDGAPPGPMSQFNTPGIDRNTGLNVGPPLPASAFDQTVLGYDSFHPGTNFHAQTDPKNQNGVVWFPGSSGVYVNQGGQKVLVGGFGVSGDGVDEDDVVTTGGIGNFDAPQSIRADQYFVSGVRLPYNKFDRNPFNGGQP